MLSMFMTCVPSWPTANYHSADEWQQALLDLEGRDILKRPSAKSPMYRFKVDLIRLWIDRTRPAL